MSSSLPPSSSSGRNSFHSSPQQFRKSRAKAAESVQHLVALISKAPRTIIATIGDTSFHATMGYVTGQTETGIVQIYGVPVGSMVTGMRVYCRKMGGMATNQVYVYDGPASALSSMGTSGSILLASMPSSNLKGALATVSNIPTSAILTGGTASGYYWHCYVYLPALPTTPVTILHFVEQNNTSMGIVLEVLPSGFLQCRSSDGHGYISTQTLTPHLMHWIVIQPGIGNGQDMMIDAVSGLYTGLQSSNDLPNMTGNGTTYAMSVCSNINGSHLLPVGSWVSKVGFGTTGGSALAASSILPQVDSDLPSISLQTSVLFLCEDAPGSTSLVNSGPGAVTGPMVLANPLTLAVSGPY